MKLIKLISVLAFALVAGVAFAAAPGKIQVGEVTGKVMLSAGDGSQKQCLVGDVFQEQTVVSTDKDSSAKIVLANGTVIALEPNTTLDVAQFSQNDPTAVEGQDFSTFKTEPEKTSGSLTTVRLIKGKASFKVAKLLSSSQLVVKTKAGQVQVKGTTFSVSDDGSFVSVAVVEGEVAIVPTGRGAVPLVSGRAVSIPVSETGVVGAVRYRSLPVAERDEILSSVGGPETPVVSGAEGTETRLDPEVPAYAEDAGVSGPDTGYLNSASSL